MTQARYYQNKSFWMLLVSIGFLLLVSVVISLIQIKRVSNIRTRADTITPSIAFQDCSVPSDQLEISEEEKKLFDQINEYRKQYGLGQLAWSVSLIQGASWMSNDMLAHKSLNHIDSLGRNPTKRLGDCGYAGYTHIGESIDSGNKSSISTLAAWQHSPVHNASLLNPNYKEAGVALASDPASNSYYWTLDLGARTQVTSTPIPSIQLTGVVVSPTQISISPLPTNILLATATPKPTFGPIPTTDPGYISNPLDMQLFVSAKITGIGTGGNRSPKHLTRHVTLSIYDLKNKLVAEGNGFIVYDRENLFRGVIHFGPVANGTYFIKILGEHMLRIVVTPTFQVLDSNRLNILPEVVLIQGDINDDNVVDIADYNLALPCFQDNRCQDKDLIDFNDDGVVNALDYNILLHDYWESQGD